MKKLLAIMGSPRKKMNTDKLLDVVLDGIRNSEEDVDIKKVYLKDLSIYHCIGCGACEKTGKCFRKDDMDELYENFNDSDGIILASPVYFNTVASLTKAMIDRCQVYWSSKYVLKNPSIDRNKKRFGLFICVGGAPYKEDQFDACTPVIDLFFRAVNTNYKGNILVSNTDVTPTWQREDITKNAYERGIRFFEGF
ncbi:NADPH-dependent FMN reductase [Gottschalkia purinilytica]|uniref:NADPH-dependent FMN reductase n=1 Tax=Gottschalkia purinilytica TaxID=1503 RepID=A0A0L0WEQ0_GOTPU|nr:flavodoxin family protein [Gottschalkia purinilytica]KNF09953.1 NADPH-dependent FMN reductase [Gottschalkia purinilytica]